MVCKACGAVAWNGSGWLAWCSFNVSSNFHGPQIIMLLSGRSVLLWSSYFRLLLCLFCSPVVPTRFVVCFSLSRMSKCTFFTSGEGNQFAPPPLRPACGRRSVVFGLPDVRISRTTTSFAGGVRSSGSRPTHSRSRPSVGVRPRGIGRQRWPVRPCFWAGIRHGHE